MKRGLGLLLLTSGLLLLLWAGAATVNGCIFPFLPPQTPLNVIVAAPSAASFGLIHGGLALLGAAAAIVGGWLVSSPASVTSQRYRQTTGHHLPFWHRTRICRLLRRTAALVWLGSGSALVWVTIQHDMTRARFWLGRLLPAMLAAAVLFLAGAMGAWRRCPQCGSRLCRRGDQKSDDRLPPIWLAPDEDWPGDAARFCPVCGFAQKKG